jgi:hypothetical protein
MLRVEPDGTTVAVCRHDFACAICKSVIEYEHPRDERPKITCTACDAPMRMLIPFTPTSYSSSSAFNKNFREFPKAGPR